MELSLCEFESFWSVRDIGLIMVSVHNFFNCVHKDQIFWHLSLVLVSCAYFIIAVS